MFLLLVMRFNDGAVESRWGVSEADDTVIIPYGHLITSRLLLGVGRQPCVR